MGHSCSIRILRDKAGKCMKNRLSEVIRTVTVRTVEYLGVVREFQPRGYLDIDLSPGVE